MLLCLIIQYFWKSFNNYDFFIVVASCVLILETTFIGFRNISIVGPEPSLNHYVINNLSFLLRDNLLRREKVREGRGGLDNSTLRLWLSTPLLIRMIVLLWYPSILSLPLYTWNSNVQEISHILLDVYLS